MNRVQGNTFYGDASMFAVGLCQSQYTQIIPWAQGFNFFISR